MRAAGVAACLVIIAAMACGGNTATEVVGPDDLRCDPTLSTTSASVPGDGGRVTVSIGVGRECAWSATSDAPWLQLSASSGQGSGTLVITAAPNPVARARTARVIVNEDPITLSQEARSCDLRLSPSSARVSSAGGRGTIQITTLDSCTWQASTDATWVSVPSGVHTGSGSVQFEVEPSDEQQRTAVIRIADRTFAIIQGGQQAPSPPPAPAPPSGAIPAPTGLAVRAISDSALELSWTNADPASGTRIYRDGAVVATKDAGATSHQDTGLARATSYTYSVQHVNGGVEGGLSGTVVGRPVFNATGGTVSSAGGYRQHLFTSSGSFVVMQGGIIDEIIVIGGGGGGGGSEAGTERAGGGGGAGGVRVITMKVESPGTIAIVIGSGGSGGTHASSNPELNTGRRGGSSSYGSESAVGGGPGAGAASNFLGSLGAAGGSGGGGSGAAGGPGTPGQGNAGGAGSNNRGGAAGGGGGGGKGGAGSPAEGGQGGRGGAGYSTWIGTVAAGGSGGRGNAGRGASGRAPGDGGEGNVSGGSGGHGATGAVLIRYRQ